MKPILFTTKHRNISNVLIKKMPFKEKNKVILSSKLEQRKQKEK